MLLQQEQAGAIQAMTVPCVQRSPALSLLCPHPACLQAICQLLTAVQQYFDAAVAVLQGQAEPQPSQPSLKPAADLQRFLNSQLASLGQRVGRAPQADIERPLAELEAAAPHLAKTYLARHLRCTKPALVVAVGRCGRAGRVHQPPCPFMLRLASPVAAPTFAAPAAIIEN